MRMVQSYTVEFNQIFCSNTVVTMSARKHQMSLFGTLFHKLYYRLPLERDNQNPAYVETFDCQGQFGHCTN